MTGAYPPSRETVDAFVARFDEATLRGNSDMALMVRAYRYQAEVIKGLHEDLRDAGRDLREMQSDINSLERQIEDRY
jgi:hypothetical protein